MAVFEDLSEEECALAALLLDDSGIDIAEFCWMDERNPDNLFRCYDYQYPWYRDKSKLQIDQCVAEGTLVMSSRGHVPIESLTDDDYVLTHEGRWQKVYAVLDQGERDVMTVKGQGHPGLRVTEDHAFFAQGSDWRTADELDRWASPRTIAPLGDIPSVSAAYASGQQNFTDTANDEWLWLYGLYIADGSVSSSYGKGGKTNRATWSVHDDQVHEVTTRLDKLGVTYNLDSHANRLVTNVRVNSEPLSVWLEENGGRGAGNKGIAPWAYGLEPMQRRAIFEGLTFGDGWTDGVRVSYKTISRALAFDVKMLAQTLGYSVGVSQYEAHTTFIEGREIKGKGGYVVEMRPLAAQRKPHVKTDERHNWSLVKGVLPSGKTRVYDLVVENDSSFVAESVVVSNCGRAVGKSLGIQLRAFAYPFNNPGEELLITAPEMIHLDPVTKYIEDRLVGVRLMREFINTARGKRGIVRRPFEATFRNNSRIIGRIPQKDGKGVKGSVAEGALITTLDGQVPVEDVRVGDWVLTHEGRFSPVEHIWSYDADCLEVAGAGHRGMVVSENHRFAGRRNRKPKGKRDLTAPSWTIADDVENTYWASPSEFPYLETPDLPESISDMRSFMWLVGRWVADGCVEGKNLTSATIIVKEAEFGEVSLMATLAGYDPRRKEHENASCVRFYAPDFTEFVTTHFGKRAEGKSIPTWLLGADKIVRDAFLEGYLSGDGHWNEDKQRWEVGTASKPLAIGIKLLGQTLDYTCSFSWVDPKHDHVMGVPLKKKPQRSWRVQLKPDGRGIFDDHLVWQKVRESKAAGSRKVYDLVVHQDHSYVADGIVHKGSSVLPQEV